MNTTSMRSLWLAYGVLLCALLGTAAGVLTALGGASAAIAILSGAGAFSGATSLLILFLTFIWTVLGDPADR